ncbi:hypothetical protein EV421DRAFT_1899391 [Armillaria borealis]|uniref:Uncharacterized protein n=1 Tax=Armillaria borealis TaxID=47425 RepID=A0AA39JVW4_9AGAR|nr:hypothetical protein EV421DRAFT_1899391 [Armillaria borealis]
MEARYGLRPHPPKVVPALIIQKCHKPTRHVPSSPLSSPLPSPPLEYRDFAVQASPFPPHPLRIFVDSAIQHPSPSPTSSLQKHRDLSSSLALPHSPLPSSEFENYQALQHPRCNTFQPVEPSHCSSPTSSENLMEARRQILAEYRSLCQQAMALRHNRYVLHVPNPDSGELEVFLAPARTLANGTKAPIPNYALHRYLLDHPEIKLYCLCAVADARSTPLPMKYIQFKNHMNVNVGQWAFACALSHSGCGYWVMYSQLVHMGDAYGLPQEALYDYSPDEHFFDDFSDFLPFEALYWSYCENAEQLSEEDELTNLLESSKSLGFTPASSPTKGGMTPRTWHHDLKDLAKKTQMPPGFTGNRSPTKTPTPRRPAPYPGPTRHPKGTFPSAKAIRAVRDVSPDEIINISSDEGDDGDDVIKEEHQEKIPAGAKKRSYSFSSIVKISDDEPAAKKTKTELFQEGSSRGAKSVKGKEKQSIHGSLTLPHIDFTNLPMASKAPMLWTLKTHGSYHSNVFLTLPAPPTLVLQDLLKTSTAFENDTATKYADDIDDIVALDSDSANEHIASELGPDILLNDLDDIPQHQAPRFTPIPIDPYKTPYRISHRNFKRSKCREASSPMPTARTIHKVILGSLACATADRVLESTLELPSLGMAHGGYATKVEKPFGAKKKYTVDELVKTRGFQYVSWDGKTPWPIVDQNGTIFAVLAGQPDDSTYLQAADDMYQIMEDKSHATNIKAKAKQPHRHGLFTGVNVGLSYGKGQQKPSMLKVHDDYQDFIGQLVLQPSVQWIATFASTAFNLWSPRLFAYYKDHLDRLHQYLGTMPLFPRSIFPCAGFNFGRFNPTAGAHLILWELKMVIEFPHAATVLIPSATITHSNTVPAPGDRQVSFMQFCAGGLLRWVDNGFRTEEALYGEDPEAYHHMQEAKYTRWQLGLGLYSSVDELLKLTHASE